MTTTEKISSYPLKYCFPINVFDLENYLIIIKLMATKISIFGFLQQSK